MLYEYRQGITVGYGEGKIHSESGLDEGSLALKYLPSYCR